MHVQASLRDSGLVRTLRGVHLSNLKSRKNIILAYQLSCPDFAIPTE